jgi:hypothetical protein
MRRLLMVLAVLAAVGGSAVAAPVASASGTVPWRDCRGVGPDASLFGRPAGGVAHRCSASVADAEALMTKGDAEALVWDDMLAFHSGELPSGSTLYVIGDEATHAIGSNAFGTIYSAKLHAYTRSGVFTVAEDCTETATVTPTIEDGSPSFTVVPTTPYACT